MVLRKPWVLQLYFHQNQWVSQSCFLWLFQSHRFSFFTKPSLSQFFTRLRKSLSTDVFVCVLQKWCLNSLKLTFKTLWSFDLTMDMRAAWNKSQKPLIVCTAGLFAWNLTSLTLCHYVIGLFTECKQTTNTKAKECGSVVSSCFFAGSIVRHPKNSCGGDNLYAATIYFPESGRLRGIELQLVFQKFWKVAKLLNWYVTWTKLEIQEWNDWKSHILFN